MYITRVIFAGMLLLAGSAAAQDGGKPIQKTTISLGTATPGGGFPLYGNNFAEAINGADPTLLIEPRNTKGSYENIPLLEAGQLDLALVAGEPAYEAFKGIGRPATRLKILTAMYSSPGMFVVRADSPYKTIRDLAGRDVDPAHRDRPNRRLLLGRLLGEAVQGQRVRQPGHVDIVVDEDELDVGVGEFAGHEGVEAVAAQHSPNHVRCELFGTDDAKALQRSTCQLLLLSRPDPSRLYESRV